MKALNLLGRLDDSLVDIDESITLTWDASGNTGHNQTWIANVGKKYAKEVGKFLREVDVKTSQGSFWILVYEKAAFAGQTVRPGVGHITHAANVELGKKKGRWTLNSDNTLSSSTGAMLNPLPKSVRSAKQIVKMLAGSAPDTTTVVTEKDAQASEKASKVEVKKELEVAFKAILPPMSKIAFNEKNNMFILKSATDRQFFGCIWKEINPGVYNVVIQSGYDGKATQLNHISDPVAVISSRLETLIMQTMVRQTLGNDILTASANSVAGVDAISSNGVVEVRVEIGSELMPLFTMKFSKGSVSGFIDGERFSESTNLNDLTKKQVASIVDRALELSPDMKEATEKWSKNDSDVSFKRIKGNWMYALLNGSKVGYASWDGNYVNFYDYNFEVQSSIDTGAYAVSAVVHDLDNGSFNESLSPMSIVQRLDAIL